MKRKMQKRDGYILPAVLMFVLFSVILGMAALELGILENREAARRSEREVAFYLAEAGLAYARAERLGENELPVTVSLNGGSFTVEYVQNGYLARGLFRGREEAVKQTSGSSGALYPAGGFVWFDHVDVNEDNVTPEDALQQGVRTDFPDKIIMPPDDWTGEEGYSEYADSDGSLHVVGEDIVIPAGDHRFRGMKASGHGKIILQDGARLHIDGDIQLPSSGIIEIAEPEDGGEARGVDIFVEDGCRIQLPGEVTTLSGDPADFRIYSNSGHTIETGDDDVKFPSRAVFHGVIYAPDAVVDLVNHTDFHGAILARIIMGRTHTTMTYYEHLISFAAGFQPGIPVRGRWTKPEWRRFESE